MISDLIVLQLLGWTRLKFISMNTLCTIKLFPSPPHIPSWLASQVNLISFSGWGKTSKNGACSAQRPQFGQIASSNARREKRNWGLFVFDWLFRTPLHCHQLLILYQSKEIYFGSIDSLFWRTHMFDILPFLTLGASHFPFLCGLGWWCWIRASKRSSWRMVWYFLAITIIQAHIMCPFFSFLSFFLGFLRIYNGKNLKNFLQYDILRVLRQ
mgnify:CR=1 FL=1